ncbi:MAG: MotA/TolQ/ExbB proton channel family protein [Myxococcota bacterium]
MDFSLLGLWNQMGVVAKIVVIILVGMSMYAIGIALERFITFRKGKNASLAYLGALQPLMASRGRIEEAAALEQQFKDAPVARVLGSGLKEFRQGLYELGSAASDTVELELLIHSVGRSMERSAKREIAGLQRGLPVLATIASSAPFVGLFGTVFGIITAFQQMADPTKGGGGGLATVSAGISEALLTTAVGLAVAIVSVWFYNFFTTRMEDMGHLIDDAAGELRDRLLHGSRRRSDPPTAGAPAAHPVPA